MLAILMVMMAYGCIENVSNGVIQIYRQLEPRFKKKNCAKIILISQCQSPNGIFKWETKGCT